MKMDFNNIDSIKSNGFLGFYFIDEINWNISIIPKKQGVYLILNKAENCPGFLGVGSGGHFKGKNPNVPIEKLEDNWIEHSKVIYIGKAGGGNSKATLQSRLLQYMKFGQGSPVGHWGGRYIWQLRDSGKLVICWKPLPHDEPRQVESTLIEQFVSLYGERPFANLVG